MAEVLGTIASGISIAQLARNLASSIIKLNSYWDQIQDPPDDIAFLVRNIESHHAILRIILEKQAQLTASCQSTGGLFQQSIRLLQDAPLQLDGPVDALTKNINSNRKWKRTLGSANILLKTEQLKRLKRRMKSATRSMHIAISWQMNTQVSVDSAVLPQTTSITVEAETKLPVDHSFHKHEPIPTMSRYNSSRWITFIFGSIGSQKVMKKNHKGAFQRSKAVYHPPARISNRSWHCTAKIYPR
ncbi:uncharacterized protein Bfra_001226 [Botrytis fragariae]|uniref:Fungal N-terminal domain-containing protein n=1 Tax=Botrytis fragariae TaxID=1964551 RepID=A0A8H6ELP1_9HELO|nr:uncharacterized protein Bfra_001226 [Botrytis fragariae]KAF5876871.1 hypothetical protein Bfra_001226 [Botrytis fragariae]